MDGSWIIDNDNIRSISVVIIDNAKEDEIKFENLIQELQRLYNRRHQIAGEKRPGASGGASINGIGFAGDFHHRF